MKDSSIRQRAARRPHIGSLRFSLGALMFLVTVAGLCLVIWKQQQDLAAAESELRMLKSKGGVLQVTDENRIQFVRVNTWGEELTWRWRIYVPPERTAKVHVAWNEIPESGVPVSRSRRDLPPGEHLITYAFRKNEEDRLAPVGDYATETRSTGRRHKTGDADFSWLEDRGNYMEQSVVGLPAETINAWLDQRTMTLDEDKPFALLRLRKKAADGDQTAPSPGFMVWIEDTTGQ